MWEKSIQGSDQDKGRSVPQIHAILPTTKGQIGIKLVESDLGDADTYLETIYGTDTQYVTVDAITTKGFL